MNIIDIEASNAFAIFMNKNPEWNDKNPFRSKIFLKSLGHELALPSMKKRDNCL